VVVNDKKQARITALDLVSELSAEANPKRLKHINDKLFETISRRISDQYLLHLIEYGIAYIYEGMPEMERQMVDELFKAEGISVLVVTQSLKWELDFKVFVVAVLDTTYFEPKTRRWVDYSIPEMAQLMSLPAVFERDRQKGKDFSNAKFVIFCQSAKKAFYKKFLFEPYPL
jgi:replicative superfamily II helicase